jgi:hypothetical protein
MWGVNDLYSLVRFQDQMIAGRIRPNCEETILYLNVPGRANNLKKFVENRDQVQGFGAESAKIRKFNLFPQTLPQKLINGDYVKVPWGSKPNFYTPQDAPTWGAPHLCISTPDGDRTLQWIDGRYESDDYFLSFDSDWCLTGPDSFEYCFEVFDFNTSVVCRSFPTGYRFIKPSGPSIYYKILDFNHEMDDFGAYHHTAVTCDLKDKDEAFPV